MLFSVSNYEKKNTFKEKYFNKIYTVNVSEAGERMCINLS